MCVAACVVIIYIDVEISIWLDYISTYIYTQIKCRWTAQFFFRKEYLESSSDP